MRVTEIMLATVMTLPARVLLVVPMKGKLAPKNSTIVASQKSNENDNHIVFVAELLAVVAVVTVTAAVVVVVEM